MLDALATLAASAAMAQVTLDGYMDRGFVSTSNTLGTKNSKLIGSNAGTTTVGIKVNENLTSDLSAGVWISTDWNDIGGATQDNSGAGALVASSAPTSATLTGSLQSSSTVVGTATISNPTGAATQAITNLGAFANSQNFLRLTSKSMGELRLGTPNNFTLTNAISVASPLFSTGIGSAYSSNFSIANGYGTGTIGAGGVVTSSNASNVENKVSNGGARAIRTPNTIQFESASFNGIKVGLGKTFKNGNANVGTATSTTDTIGVTEFMLRYTNGPIDAMYTSIKYETNGIVALNWGTTALSNASNTQTLLAATYTVIPSLKLHAGYGSFTSSNDLWKGKSSQYGVTYTMGQWDFLGQIVKVDDQTTTADANKVFNTTANMDRKLTGIGVNYNLSKTTRAYLRYDDINYYSNGTAAAGTAQKRTALGMSVNF